MSDKSIYYGATEKELRDISTSKRLIGLVDHRKLFPHHGQIWLEPDQLILEGWMEVSKPWIHAATIEFTDVYSRLLAAGMRGQGSGLGVLAGGRPLILRRARGKSPIYLLIDYRWLTGTNKNNIWQQRISSWLNELSST